MTGGCDQGFYERMAELIHALIGDSKINNVTRSTMAPKRAPGGTVFHQGAIDAKDNTEPRILSGSQLSLWNITASPAVTRASAEVSQTIPQMRPKVECIRSFGDKIDGRALNPSGGLPENASAPPKFANPCTMSGIAIRKRIIVTLQAQD